MRFIEARTPHEARPLKIAHGSDALCRDAQLSRTPPSDRRVCGAAPLVLGRLRLLADRRSVPQFASPSDRIHRDSVAGLFGSGKATSPYPGSTRRSRETDSPYPGRDSPEPRNGLDGAGKRTRRAREANSREPGSELDGAGERTRRSRGADATEPGSGLVVPARSGSRPPCAPTPRSKRPPLSRRRRRPAKPAISPHPGRPWHVVHVGRAPDAAARGSALDWQLMHGVRPRYADPAPPTARPSRRSRPLRPLPTRPCPPLPPLPPLPTLPTTPAGKFHDSRFQWRWTASDAAPAGRPGSRRRPSRPGRGARDRAAGGRRR